MSLPDKSDSELWRLADEYSRAEDTERRAYAGVEPMATRCREARQALYVEAARVVLADPSQIAEVATVLVYDTSVSSLDAVAQQLGQAVTWWVREKWRELAPRTE